MPIISLVFGGILFLSICFYFIFLGSGENAALENEIFYSKVALTFLTDYDNENPLTKR